MYRIWTTLFLPPFPKDVLELSSSALKVISYIERQELKQNNLRMPVLEADRDLNQCMFLPKPITDVTEGFSFSPKYPSELRLSREREESINFENINYSTHKSEQEKHLQFIQNPQFELVNSAFNKDQVENHEDLRENSITYFDGVTANKCYNLYFSNDPNSRTQGNNLCLNQSVDMFEDTMTQRDEVMTSRYFRNETTKRAPISCKRKKVQKNKKITSYFPVTKIESIKQLDLYMPPASFNQCSYLNQNIQGNSEYDEKPSTLSNVPFVTSAHSAFVKVNRKNVTVSAEKTKNINTKSPLSKKTVHGEPGSSSLSECNNHANRSFVKSSVDTTLNNKGESTVTAIEYNTMQSQNGALNSSLYDNNSQIASYKSESSYEIIHTFSEDSELIFSLLTSNAIAEIGMTLCYREGFCLLNKGQKKNCTPNNILLCARYLDESYKFLYFTEECLKQPSFQNILLHVLRSFTRKICFEAQALILFILDSMELKDPRVCYEWCILDPLIGGWLLDPDHPPSLFEELRKKWLNQEVATNKDWLKECGNLLLQQSQVMELLYKQLMKENIWDVFLYLETKIIPILAVMEASETLIDREKVKDTSLILNEKLKTLEKEAEQLIGHKISLNSTEQLRKLLYEELKLDEVSNVKIKGTSIKGVKSTSESMLKLLVDVHPLPKLILEHRQLFKLKSSYTDVFLEHTKEKNCISAMWDLCSTATGRVTSSNPNLQNIPKQNIYVTIGNQEKLINLRSCFVAREDSLFVSADFQHIELRVFAILAKDRALLGLLRKKGDIFTIMTEIRLNKEEITTEERNQTKTLVYALMYGAGVKRIADILSLDSKEAENVRNKFLGIFPGLQEFNYQVLCEVRKYGVLKSISGRKRIFPNISSMNLVQRKYSERQAINFIIQGSAADICKGAMLRTEQKLKDSNLNTKLLMQIHDELLWEVKSSELQIFQEIVKESMEANRRFWIEKVNTDIPLPVAIRTGKDWGNMQ